MSSAPEPFAPARSRRARTATTLYFTGAALVALAVWLFLPVDAAGGAPITVCVVDTSASALRVRPAWKRELPAAIAARAERARTEGSDFAVIAFGADVRRVFGPGSPGDYVSENPKFLAHDDAATPLARALDVARDLALAPEHADARVILFSDGTWTGEDPRSRLAEISAAGATVELAALPPPDLVDVAIEQLELPRRIEIGAPLVARVDLRAAGPLHGAIDVVLTCTNANGEFTRERTVPLAETVSVDVDLGVTVAGRTLVRATVRMAGGHTDPIPENDAATASVVGAGAISVAVVAPQAMRTDWLRALASTGLSIEHIEPSAIPRALADVDVLVTAGVGLSDIARDHLEPFLQRGGGWLAFAGGEWLERNEPGGVIELSALTPATDGDDRRDVVLLVDGSGSMTGAPFDVVRATVLRLADRAPARGVIDLRIFGASLGPALPIRGDRGESRDAVRARLSGALPTNAPGGPTRLFDALDELARETSSAPRLVVLFSDGRDDSAPDPTARAGAVREGLIQARIELRAISAGPAANVERLASLLREGERVIRADTLDEAALAELFAREIARDRWRTGHELAVLQVARGSGRELVDAILGGESHPPIERYLRMRESPDSEIAWVSEHGEPLLALHRVGLGVAATAAFLPIDGCASFSPLLRALGRRSRTSEPTIEAQDGKLVALDLPIDAPAEIEATIVVPAQGTAAPRQITVRLLPEVAAPDPRTVRAAPWPALLDEVQGGALLPVTLLAAGGAKRWETTLSVDVGREFRSRAEDRLDFAASSVSSPTSPQGASHPAARNVLGLGLLCLCIGALLGGLGRAALSESGRREVRSQALQGPGRQGEMRA